MNRPVASRGLNRHFNLYYLHWWTLTYFVFETPQHRERALALVQRGGGLDTDRKSTRLNSSHRRTSYAVFCLRDTRGRRCRTAIHQPHRGIFAPVVAVLRHVGFFRSGTPAMVHHLPILRPKTI